MIKAENAGYTYQPGMPFEHRAVHNINLHIEKGSLTAIIGHTGSGKSTLIQMFNALLLPTEGKIFIDGQDTAAPGTKLSDIRKKVGLVFQYPEYQLFEETVERDIAFGPRNLGLSDDEVHERTRLAAAQAGLCEKYMSRSPFELSGGQKRRAAIAGVLAMRPDILILDEPAAGLDPQGRRSILATLKKLHSDEPDLTIIFVSHSMEDVAGIAERIIVMNNGEIAAHGSVREVFSHSDMLIGMGLNVPQITVIFEKLRACGFDLPRDVYTVEEGARILISVLGGGSNVW